MNGREKAAQQADATGQAFGLTLIDKAVMSQESSPLTIVRNADSVSDWFGRWPAFHDAQLVAFNYQAVDDKASFTLHAFEMTDRVDAEGYVELEKHCLITFHVRGSVRVELQKFALGNVLLELQVVLDDKRVVL